MIDSSPGNNSLKILLVDDQVLMRSGIARLIADIPDMNVIGQVSSGEEAIDFVKNPEEPNPDIVVMDARLPGMGGIEACRAMLEYSPKLRLLALSSVASGVIPSQMLRTGAQGFITKNVEVMELLKAIRAVADGQRYVSTEVATHLALDPFNHDGSSLFDRLSRREMQIAQLLTDGKKVSQISSHLELSPKTVYSYRYRIFEKLGISSDVELTILAVKHGLTDDTQELDQYPGGRTGRIAS